jgi:hypothetical protein
MKELTSTYKVHQSYSISAKRKDAHPQQVDWICELIKDSIEKQSSFAKCPHLSFSITSFLRVKNTIPSLLYLWNEPISSQSSLISK